MARYLVRVANREGYTPRDVQQVSNTIRNILGARENASHFRVATRAVEFNMFAKDQKELEDRRRLLTQNEFDIVDLRPLDIPPKTVGKKEALAEGVQLFNEEQFWESHEILEEAWNLSKGAERDGVQSLILTAAAFVHHQKGEDEICLSILRRARTKMTSAETNGIIDLESLRENIDGILNSQQVELFKLPIGRI